MLVAEEGGRDGGTFPSGAQTPRPVQPGTPLCSDLQLPSHIRSRRPLPLPGPSGGGRTAGAAAGGRKWGGGREGDGSGKPQAQLHFPRGPCGSSGVHPRAPPPGGAQGAREAATRMGCGDPSTRQGVQARLHSSPGGGRGHWGLHPECGFTGASPQAGPEPRLLTGVLQWHSSGPMGEGNMPSPPPTPQTAPLHLFHRTG